MLCSCKDLVPRRISLQRIFAELQPNDAQKDVGKFDSRTHPRKIGRGWIHERELQIETRLRFDIELADEIRQKGSFGNDIGWSSNQDAQAIFANVRWSGLYHGFWFRISHRRGSGNRHPQSLRDGF